MNKEKRGGQPIKERRIITNPDAINTTPINATTNPEARCFTPRNVNVQIKQHWRDLCSN